MISKSSRLPGALKESQLIAEAQKAKLDIDPTHGPRIEMMVQALPEFEPPAAVSRVKPLLESTQSEVPKA